jgi:hypothetical protein
MQYGNHASVSASPGLNGVFSSSPFTRGFRH